MAVRIGELEDSSLVARKVGETRRVVVSSPSYLAIRKRPRSPADLRSHAIVQFRALSPSPEWRFRRGGREERIAVTPSFTTNSADAAIGQAERGGGLTLVLGYQVMDAVKAGRLEVVLPGFEPPPLPIHLVYPGTRLLSANVRAFVDLTLATRDWRFVDF